MPYILSHRPSLYHSGNVFFFPVLLRLKVHDIPVSDQQFFIKSDASVRLKVKVDVWTETLDGSQVKKTSLVKSITFEYSLENLLGGCWVGET